jgi:hypothetical protein
MTFILLISSIEKKKKKKTGQGPNWKPPKRQKQQTA